MWFIIIPILESHSQGVNVAPRPEKTNKIIDEWVEGTVIYANGNTRECTFAYSPLVPEGLLKIKQGDQIITETVFDVAEFYYYDTKKGIKHHYISFEVEPKKRFFVEVLYSGNTYSLIGRKGIVIHMHVGDNNYKSSFVSPNYFYYLVRMKDFSIARFRGNQIYRLLKDNKKKLKHFARQNNLSTQKKEGLIAIIAYYHSLLHK